MTTDASIVPTTGNKVWEEEPVTRAIKYHHLGLAVTNLAASTEFYGKLGFAAKEGNPDILVNSIGMELHLLQADEALIDKETNEK